MSVPTWNAADLDMSFNGIPITGLPDGTFLKAYRNNDMWIRGGGADGYGWRSKSNDKSGTIEITLPQTSNANDRLSAMQILDEATSEGAGVFMARDRSGRSVVFAENAWIVKPADAEFAREATDRPWKLETPVIEIFNGGNGTLI